MKKLSNADLQILYLRRAWIREFLQIIAVQVSNYQDSWERLRDQINDVRKEIQAIVEDPRFDTLVPVAKTAHPDQHTYSPSKTMINTASTARQLLSYVETVLNLYITPKSEELEKKPEKKPTIFISHGSNEIVRNKVKGFIAERCNCDVIVLQEKPSSGMTVIEKLEKFGRLADYAVIILTADDVMQEGGEPRARENVIQELGWFQGVLGRNRTAILLQKGTNVASNLAGIVRLEFEDNDVEIKFEDLRKEFEEAGIL